MLTNHITRLPLLGVLGILVIYAGDAAKADTGTAMGPTSEASVGISVSVRPRIHVTTSQVRTAAQNVGGVAGGENGNVCVSTNMPEGRFTVSIEYVEGGLPTRKSMTPTAIHPAGSAMCPLAPLNKNQGAAFPVALPSSATPPRLVQLMISPD